MPGELNKVQKNKLDKAMKAPITKDPSDAIRKAGW